MTNGPMTDAGAKGQLTHQRGTTVLGKALSFRRAVATALGPTKLCQTENPRIG